MEKLGMLLGSGKEADVYACGAFALKLYKSSNAKVSAFREAANLAIVQELGLLVPKVHRVGLYFDRWGIVMDRASECDDPASTEPDRRQADARSMARLHISIHECAGHGLPP